MEFFSFLGLPELIPQTGPGKRYFLAQNWDAEGFTENLWVPFLRPSKKLAQGGPKGVVLGFLGPKILCAIPLYKGLETREKEARGFLAGNFWVMWNGKVFPKKKGGPCFEGLGNL